MSDLTTRLLDEINRHAEYPNETAWAECPRCGRMATGSEEYRDYDDGHGGHTIVPTMVVTRLFHGNDDACEFVDYPPKFTRYTVHVDRGQPVLPPPWAALKAIAELHESRLTMVPGGSLPACRVCGTGPDCETMRALARSLGVDA